MKHIDSEQRTVAVIGGGHAGCEAALATARMGFQTILFAINLDSIAMMPCNPCIGGSAKGHLVREIDALGGEMGKAIDACYLQSRMLNASKGPAVYSLRAQADKARYAAYMKRVLETTPNLSIRQSEILAVITQHGRVTGVRSESGAVYPCDAAVVCTGTYLRARCLYGETMLQNGPNGQRASYQLSDSLSELGFQLMRFKTGTPARVLRSSLCFSKMTIQQGDEPVTPFSFETDPETIQRPQIPCYLTYTNEETHRIIRANLHRSPMYSGVIEGTGTRYCPSIEDKIVRFADKTRHQVFIEPEGEGTEEMYVQGLSSSLPEDVQIALYRTIPGLENCRFTRNAYAIEYDCIDATCLKLSLEARDVAGLFFAGQINGSSGYEEAAAQGIVAGINAALYLRGEPAMLIDRSEGYIGVLIDDMVTKGSREPYRMMTSRAEYRLLLRQDNADLRLTEKGYRVGLVPAARYARFLAKKAAVEQAVAYATHANIAPSEAVNGFLTAMGSAPIRTGCKLAELVRRPGLTYAALTAIDTARPGYMGETYQAPVVGTAVQSEGIVFKPYEQKAIDEQVNIQIKYEGYIKMQIAQVEAFKKLEHQPLPPELDYEAITGLRLEARQKLAARRPEHIGQASRITGVSPADINVLLVYLNKFSRIHYKQERIGSGQS